MADTYDREERLNEGIAALAEMKAFAADLPELASAEFARNLDRVELLVEGAKQLVEQAKQARSAMFLYLAERHPQIAHILMKYDGYGDEGQIDDIAYFGSDNPVTSPLHVEDDKLEALLYDVWEKELPDGFEINEGGFGSINIYPANQKVVVEHQDRPEETQDEEEDK